MADHVTYLVLETEERTAGLNGWHTRQFLKVASPTYVGWAASDVFERIK